MRKRYLIESPRFLGNPYIRTASSSDWFTLMGVPQLANAAKWPDEGIASRLVDAMCVDLDVDTTSMVKVMIWVETIQRTTDHKSSKHRVMCECPGCGRFLSAGRLFQHVCKS